MQRLGLDGERRGVDRLDVIEASTTTSTAIPQFEKMIGGLGFHACVMADIPAPETEQPAIANGGPTQGFNMDDRGDLCAVGPIRGHCFKAPKPFERQDVPHGPEYDRAAYSAMTDGRQRGDFRVHEDLCIPIHHDAAAGAITGAARPTLT